jgi:hypothetical protein
VGTRARCQLTAGKRAPDLFRSENRKEKNMSKSVAIVTGASSGIGKATALRLGRDFGAIVLAARSGEKLGGVGEQVKAIGAEPLVLELDLMAPTEDGVHVNSVSPGAIMTGRRLAMLEKAAPPRRSRLKKPSSSCSSRPASAVSVKPSRTLNRSLWRKGVTAVPHVRRTPERLSAFSDGVFAVLITVLVLELRPPELPTFKALLSLGPTWLSYAVSYLFIAIVWANHHHLMHYATEATPRLM